jgi:hypothetical protein
MLSDHFGQPLFLLDQPLLHIRDKLITNPDELHFIFTVSPPFSCKNLDSLWTSGGL